MKLYLTVSLKVKRKWNESLQKRFGKKH